MTTSTSSQTHAPQIITFTARETAELQPQRISDAPLAADEIAGVTLFSLASPGTETAVFRGDYTDFPVTPGYAAVFQIEEVGADVTNFQRGDVALAMGPHASRQRCKATEANLVPPGLAPETAIFARLMGVPMSTLSTTAARPPARVIVTGLGIIGNLAAQDFRACGYTVLGCDPSAQRRELAEKCGLETRATVPLDDADWQDKTALVVECSGHEGAALDGCKIVRPGGEVFLVGTPWQRRTEKFAHEITNAVFFRYVVLRSGWEWQVPRHDTPFAQASIARNLEAALLWLHQNRVHTEGLATTFSPNDCHAAYQTLLNASQPHLTITFDWRA